MYIDSFFKINFKKSPCHRFTKFQALPAVALAGPDQMISLALHGPCLHGPHFQKLTKSKVPCSVLPASLAYHHHHSMPAQTSSNNTLQPRDSKCCSLTRCMESSPVLASTAAPMTPASATESASVGSSWDLAQCPAESCIHYPESPWVQGIPAQ